MMTLQFHAFCITKSNAQHILREHMVEFQLIWKQEWREIVKDFIIVSVSIDKFYILFLPNINVKWWEIAYMHQQNNKQDIENWCTSFKFMYIECTNTFYLNETKIKKNKSIR